METERRQRQGRVLDIQTVARAGVPTFTDLPWGQPLSDWRSGRIVDVPRGIHQHVVRFIAYGDDLFAFKELDDDDARHEYRLLRSMGAATVPAVEAVGLVSRGGRREDLPAMLITRYLAFSLPYRQVFTGRVTAELRTHLLDALAGLLVRVHLAGFVWGDCSLSNTLFRRDAGTLAAYLVDADSAQQHDALSDVDRRQDLDIGKLNIAAELFELEAQQAPMPGGMRPMETAAEIVRRYDALYEAVTREEVFGPDESYRIEERLRSLNELGFDVEEIELEGVGDVRRLRLNPQVVESGHHRRRLQMLTGLDVQENQARRLLHDIARHRAQLERVGGRVVPESVAAYRWVTDVFTPSIALVPEALRGKREAAELFHELLDHRWYLSEVAGHDVGTETAVRAYVETVLRFTPDERVLPDDADVAANGVAGRG
jgi:hypothetical protein